MVSLGIVLSEQSSADTVERHIELPSGGNLPKLEQRLLSNQSYRLATQTY